MRGGFSMPDYDEASELIGVNGRFLNGFVGLGFTPDRNVLF